MLIGVLALQGAFVEHQKTLAGCGVDSRQVRKPEDLAGVDGLIIPGGESTTIGKLLLDYYLFQPVKEMAFRGMPIFGTCAGMVLLARDIFESSQPRLGLMDIKVKRNAFGRQVESFEEELEIPVLGERLFRAIFIRAPVVMEADPKVQVLASYNGQAVCVRQGRFMAAAFHPELTTDLRLHRYFLEECCQNANLGIYK